MDADGSAIAARASRIHRKSSLTKPRPISGRYTAAVTSRAVNAATAASNVESAERRLANRLLRTLLVLPLRVLRRLAFGNRQRFPRGSGEVAREVHHLADVVRRVRRRAVQCLDHEEGFAANRHRASQ